MTFLAHSNPAELLEKHLHDCAARAAQFAGAFGAPTLGHVLGLWHDLGKYSSEFQRMINRSGADDDSDDEQAATVRLRVDHSSFGAQLATKAMTPPLGRLMAYCIAGHHAGLADWHQTDGGSSCLGIRLQQAKPEIESARRNVPQELLQPPPIDMREVARIVGDEASEAAFRLSFFCRVLFSCLVDADRTCTEANADKERAALRQAPLPAIVELTRHLRAFLEDAFCDVEQTPVNAKRAEVLASCRDRAADRPGFFSLTVPTGGGKTLSGLAFALEHASRHGLRRVIYAAPYTSIIEQNADVLRKALGGLADDALIEHHSNLDPDKPRTSRAELVTENWDAPIIVTTHVQLLESLYAYRTSTCRKLHNIARSVIVLDEAQSLPLALLKPILTTLRELVRAYECSTVLCTATQPAVVRRETFPIGLPRVREIMGDRVPALFGALRRVEVEQAGPLSDEQVAGMIVAEERCLCIVNSRAHASALFGLVRAQAPDALHLSANMCPAHRSDLVAEMKRRLMGREPCRVVSTQVVEAGVDIDFPIVLRAMAGLDSVAQAAGRCNREGKLSGGGRTLVFGTAWNASGKVPQSIVQAAQHTEHVLHEHSDDPLAPSALQAYFERVYQEDERRPKEQRWDHGGVIHCFAIEPNGAIRADFRRAAAAFKMIDDWQVPIIVPYMTSAEDLLARAKAAIESHDRRVLREFQRLTVNVPEYVRAKMVGGPVNDEHDPFFVLNNATAYDDRLGLQPEVVGMDPAMLIQ